MIQRGSKTIDEHLRMFFEQHDSYAAAVRRQDVPAANRCLLKVSSCLDAVAGLPGGKALLEKLLDHDEPYIRLRAAGSVMDWMPDLAIPVFGRLLAEDINNLSPYERLDIHAEAVGWLYKYFKIRSFNQNDLIEPLRAYGVELPYRDYAAWQ